jgi:hypothetical protein
VGGAVFIHATAAVQHSENSETTTVLAAQIKSPAGDWGVYPNALSV